MPKGIQPLSEYVGRVSEGGTARLRERLRAERTLAATDGEFEKMRRHVLKYYEGVEAVHSFTDGYGNVFDCMPIDKQPGVLLGGEPPPKPPEPPDAEEDRGIQSMLREGPVDPLGNSMFCPPGAVPMKRLILDHMAEHQTIDAWGLGKKRAPPGPHDLQRPINENDGRLKWVENLGDIHAHAVQQTINVPSIGLHTCMSVHTQPIDGAKNQAFVLSQWWLVNGTGYGPDPGTKQSLEGGWIIEPSTTRTPHPTLFTFYSANDYASWGPGQTSRNNQAGDFVQVSNRWLLEGSLEPSSVVDGEQRFIEMACYLSGDRWWFYAGGTSASNAFGYYPASIYGTGLMRTRGMSPQYGGEVCSSPYQPNPNLFHLAPMGTGQPGTAGWRKAAYHRDVRHYPTTGGSAHSIPSSLFAPSPQDTALGYVRQSSAFAAPWNRTVFYGGPGGTWNIATDSPA